MQAVYNLIQFIGLIVFWPVFLLLILCKAKYRLRIPVRLGFGLGNLAEKIPDGHPRIWIHALSVGEVSSALRLVHAIRENFPQAVLLFSTTTSSGEKFVRNHRELPVDLFVPFPIDLYPVVRRFVKLLQPDLFILVETDFWPNLISQLQFCKIPTLLVNGRISRESYKKYSNFQAFFLPMFQAFTCLAMQRQEDMDKMISLGVDAERIKMLGNLKYEAMLPKQCKVAPARSSLGIDEKCLLIIAGSTHEGEEEILCGVYQSLAENFPSLYLILAPRNIERVSAVEKLVRKKGLHVSRRTQGTHVGDQVMLLDTMGELAGLYPLADVSFIGGTLVEEGGHNPLEPAAAGVPVFFGPHMEDFADVQEDMLAADCAEQVAGGEDLEMRMSEYLRDAAKRKTKGEAARKFVESRKGVILHHIDLIRQVLS